MRQYSDAVLTGIGEKSIYLYKIYSIEVKYSLY